jgi:hypothetical protein
MRLFAVIVLAEIAGLLELGLTVKVATIHRNHCSEATM